MATTLWCGETREHGPRATVAVEYQLAACDATEPPMRNTIGTVKVGSLIDDRFTNKNLEYICLKVEQWAMLHFSKNRFPSPQRVKEWVEASGFSVREWVLPTLLPETLREWVFSR